jgi:hypothetical protein
MIKMGAMFFVYSSLILLLGFMVCHRHGKDVGHTMGQLYLIDAAIHLVGLVAYLSLPQGKFIIVLFFILRSISIGLSFCRILAVSSLLILPDQPSWPNFIWFMKQKPDVPRTELQDTVIWIAVALFMILGALLAYFYTGTDIAIYYSILTCIVIFVLRAQIVYVETKAGALPVDLVHIASIIDNIKNPEDRAYMINIAVGALGKVSQGLIDGRKKMDADEAMAPIDSDKR